MVSFVDYDMGREGMLMKIVYHKTYDEQGQWKVWNEGRQYRNDGVDIAGSDGQYYVSWTEVGEWLQYTIVLDMDTISDLVFMASGNSGIIIMDMNEKVEVAKLELNRSTEWVQQSRGLNLSEGENRIRFKLGLV